MLIWLLAIEKYLNKKFVSSASIVNDNADPLSYVWSLKYFDITFSFKVDNFTKLTFSFASQTEQLFSRVQFNSLNIKFRTNHLKSSGL